MTRRTYKRQESWRLKRVKPAWRRPRGGTSRIRLEASGWPRMPNVGLRGDAKTRGLHPSGLQERRVSQERDLEGLDSKKHIVRLSHQLGEKKRLVLVEKITRLNVKIANPGALESAKPAPTVEGETAAEKSPSPDENIAGADSEAEGVSKAESEASRGKEDEE